MGKDVGRLTVVMIRLLATEFDPPGRLVESSAHEYAAGAVVHRYSVPEGSVRRTV